MSSGSDTVIFFTISLYHSPEVAIRNWPTVRARSPARRSAIGRAVSLHSHSVLPPLAVANNNLTADRVFRAVSNADDPRTIASAAYNAAVSLRPDDVAAGVLALV